MSTEANKYQKRVMVYQEMKKASEALRQASDKLATASEALAALVKALKRIEQAGQWAEATKLQWEEKGQPQSKVKRDALPGAVRRKIAKLGEQVEKLMAQVKAIPVTAGERATAEVEKVKRRRRAGTG